ncbi:hypothetical protein BHF68_14565 [Desulfuribacillus alkaliarsenatis]|uniref:Potassium channel domain-containing protein n=2 Tax=Desulfuribacillus alkaliarsenatis TaxID=766136 RepID=A0A1E5G3H1_9FIRM|nr:hypothetical protein BHF68_14565 [Desulfuribacillus alkaliarsenatis]
MKSQFLFLLAVYINVVILFALLYSLFDIVNLGSLVDHYNGSYKLNEPMNAGSTRVLNALYFSVITLFSIGYGDVTPFGLSRFLAIIQAMLGYILPAVLVIRFMKISID